MFRTQSIHLRDYLGVCGVSQKLEAIAVDIRLRVFDNRHEGMLYVMRDVDAAETLYVFSMNAYSFSLTVREDYVKEDLLKGLRYEGLFQPEVKDNLKQEMRRIIAEWHEPVRSFDDADAEIQLFRYDR